MTRDLLGWLGGMLFAAGLLGGLYLLGRHHGAEARDDWWRAGMARIDAEVGRQQTQAQKRADVLAADIEQLRKRPERVRTITNEVIRYVQPDVDCRSLPESVRVLWAAGSADDPAASATGVDDAGVSAVAGAGR